MLQVANSRCATQIWELTFHHRYEPCLYIVHDMLYLSIFISYIILANASMITPTRVNAYFTIERDEQLKHETVRNKKNEQMKHLNSKFNQI